MARFFYPALDQGNIKFVLVVGFCEDVVAHHASKNCYCDCVGGYIRLLAQSISALSYPWQASTGLPLPGT